MVLKFLTAGVISAILAGGAMYLAMDDEMLAQLRAEAQGVRSGDSVPALRRNAETPVEGGTVVDRLLGRDDMDRNDDPSAVEPTSTAETLPTETPSRVGQTVEDAPPKRGWLDDFLPRRDTVATPIPVTREPDVPGPVDPAVFATLIEQAALVEIVDARDDAYFNILNFSLSEGRYDVAAGLVENLSSPELRDTARQRIGIRHAQAGRMDKAFAVLDDIEIKELTDPIRLEIIRSVTMSRQPG
ncbi:MAG: hypothetical protein ACSHX3_06895 [Litorimonas sp.]